MINMMAHYRTKPRLANRQNKTRGRAVYKLCNALGIAISISTIICGNSASARTGDYLDRSKYLGKLEFNETFMASSLQSGVWISHFIRNGESSERSRIYGGDDLQIFSDLKYNGANPFILTNPGIEIISKKLTAKDVNQSRPYTSGMLRSNIIGQVPYGYYEADIKASSEVGTWPAFWLLNSDDRNAKHEEVDVFEALGAKPNIVYQSVHTSDVWGKSHQQIHAYCNLTWSNYHTYGVLIDKKWIVFYVDNIESARQPNDGLINQPLFVIISLAVGPASWNRNIPDGNFQGATFNIRYVRVYSLRATDSENNQFMESSYNLFERFRGGVRHILAKITGNECLVGN